MDSKQLLQMGFVFHGHRCPAMPLGFRAGLAGIKVLALERCKDKELYVISETGKGHAAACFLDGVMVATGCTYGKSNIEKLHYNKIAFTLVELGSKKAVRVSLKPEFLYKMLQSPFVKQRRQGVPPQVIPREITDPLIDRILCMPEESFLTIGPVTAYELEKGKAVFEVAPCAKCGEGVFVNKLVEGAEGLICLGCKRKEDKSS